MSRRRKGTSTWRSSPAERVSFAVSLLVLAGVVATIVVLWWREPAGPPRFRVELGEVRSEAGRSYLPVTIINEGGAAARQVRIEGRTAGSEERPTATIDFLPVRGREEVVLTFAVHPARTGVDVVSYQQP
jgi:uncharacterized protein (TIGR02588 family)